MKTYEAVLAWLAKECSQRIVGLGQITWVVKGDLCLTDTGAVRGTTLSLVRDLVSAHGVVVGPSSVVGPWVTWDLPLKCLLDRVDFEMAVMST
jgi:hypothetical protein